MNLKITFFGLLLICLVWVSCEDPKNPDEEKTKVTLKLDKGVEIASSGSPQIHWVRQINGKWVVRQMSQAMPAEMEAYTQFRSVEQLSPGKYATSAGKSIVILGDKVRYESPLNRGFLAWNSFNGFMLAMGLEEDCPPVVVEASRGEILRGGKSMGTAYTVKSTKTEQDDDGTWFVVKSVVGTGTSQVIPNDTGTVVVILDNFRLSNPVCCEEGFSDCCAGLAEGDATGSMPTADEGYQILRSFNIAEICIVERCQMLIVHNCVTGETVCFDTLESLLKVQVSRKGWLSVSIPTENANLPVIHTCEG